MEGDGSRPILRQYTEHMEILSQDDRLPDKESKLEPPEFEVGVLASLSVTTFGLMVYF